VTFWHAWSGEAGEAIQEAVRAFNAENELGITAEAVYQGNYNDLYAKIDSALQAGEPPQLAAAYAEQILAWEQAQEDTITDLEPYVNDPGWGLTEAEQSDFFPVFWESDLVEGTRVGLPAQRSAYVIAYNTTWAKELGFSSPPETPAQFRTQACAAANANRLDADPDNDGTGGWAVNTAPSAILSWFYAFDSPVVRPDGSGYAFNTPESEEALTFLKGLYDAGCAWLKPDTSPIEYAEAEFAARQALFITTALADLPQLDAALRAANNRDRWTVIGFPSAVKEPVIGTFGPSFTVFKGTPEEQLAAWLLAKWLSAPEQQARFIQASGTFPTRATALDLLDSYATDQPQWAAAQELLTNARSEPTYASWGVVRWVVGDVGTQVFRYYFTGDRISATLELMDETAAELHARPPEPPTGTATP
jgi:ABC-type glycerol-3-phosphate transport system substrate-binding protein